MKNTLGLYMIWRESMSFAYLSRIDSRIIILNESVQLVYCSSEVFQGLFFYEVKPTFDGLKK